MKYYIAENGQPAGPFELKELMDHGLTVNSQVWNESMTGWTAASNVPEVMDLLRQSTQPAVATPVAPVAPVEPVEPIEPQPPVEDYSAYQPQPEETYQPPQYGAPQPEPAQNYQQPQYGAPQPQYGPAQSNYAQPQYGRPHGPMPADWKTANIIITIISVLCCCNPISLVTGIVGIVKSSNVRTLYNTGNQAEAEQMAASAKMWFFISLALMLVLSLAAGIYIWNDAGVYQAMVDGYNNGYTDI